MTKSEKHTHFLSAIADEYIDDLLTMTDEEILGEAAESGDANGVAGNRRAAAEKLVAASRAALGAARSKSPDILYAWTVYFNPMDFPGKYVVRRFGIGTDGVPIPAMAPTAVVDSLEAARRFIPLGLVRFARRDCDPQAILETWI